jgi:hypothetical protein
VDPERIRKDFLDSSFEPAVPATPVAPAMYRENRGKPATRVDLVLQPNHGSSFSAPSKKTPAKPSRLNMMGFFKSSKK